MMTGRRHRQRPSVEALEDRTLMASQLTASLSGGVLRIEGTNSSDSIVLRQSHGRISIDNLRIQNGASLVSNIAASSVAKVSIRSLEGDDQVLLGTDASRGPNGFVTPVEVWAGGGNDLVRSGHGSDVLYGEAGNDEIHGRGGNDLIDGGLGDDRLDGGYGNDLLRGQTGYDRLWGAPGNDRLEGGNENDGLLGGTDNDILDGGYGDNYLGGEAGNDLFYSRSLHDRLDGGTGQDVAQFLGAAAPRSANPGGAVRDIEVFQHPSAAATTTTTSSVNLQAEAQRLLDLTNAYRVSRGLPRLTLDSRLAAAARYQADYMVRTGNYSHINLDGRDLADRVQAAGYSFSYAAENIHLYDPAVRRSVGVDRVYSLSELAQYFLDGWKASSGHNLNLLSRTPNHIGIAMAQDRTGRIYAVQVFGKQ